jgi:hypothetical protein
MATNYATIANYVFCEPFRVAEADNEASEFVGQSMVIFYLEFNKSRAKADKFVITTAQALQMRDDLNKILRLQDEGQEYEPPEDWTPDDCGNVDQD